jgi:hypothetical protein
MWKVEWRYWQGCTTWRGRRISRRYPYSVSRWLLPLCGLRLPLWCSGSIVKDRDGDEGTRSILNEIIDKVLELLGHLADRRCLALPFPWSWPWRLVLRLLLDPVLRLRLLLWLRLPLWLGLGLGGRLLLRQWCICGQRFVKDQIEADGYEVACLRPAERTVICNVRKGLRTGARKWRRRHGACPSRDSSCSTTKKVLKTISCARELQNMYSGSGTYRHAIR